MWKDKVVGVAELGRTADKYTQTSTAIFKLEEQAVALLARLRPYRPYFPQEFKRSKEVKADRDPFTLAVGETQICVDSSKGIVADRIKVTAAPTFDCSLLVASVPRRVADQPDPRDFLIDPAAAVMEPPWSRAPKVIVRASKVELLKMLTKLDQSSRLLLLLVSLAPPKGERNGWFAVYKDADNDRLILDARPPNRKEIGLVFWVRLLVAPGSLVDCVLEPNEMVAQYAEDAVDYYNRWLVTVERAVRNSLAVELRVSDVKHLRACPELPDGAFVVPAVYALAMGDLQAVELGQLGHLAIAVRA
ncbi:unnamed protein product [Polarella glacialis]|uniref:Uncharacterized protein n=1 Tax=Polarella glacialis TaxID=89957 RepID=A0A813FYS6_POLGL|nr:unnamed protein product [Polarella glacialis]